MATTILQLYGNSARQIRPAVINTFQNNGNVDRLEFQMEDYNQDNVDLSTMDAYAIVYGSLGLDEIKLESEVTSDGVLKIYWDLNSYTLALGEKIFYQICFKSEGSQVWTSYKGVIFCNESLTADEEIVAQYPTILKQMEGRIETRTDEAIDEFTVIASEQLNNTVERVNELADNFDASVVYVPYGETIPIEDRLNNRLYYIYTDEEHSSGRFEDSEGTTLFLDMSGCGNLFIGQTVFSLLPIKNSCVHLLDGSKLYGEGTYSGFVEYASRLYKNKPSSNVNLVGDLTDVDCVLSGFSSTNYATLPNVFSPESKPWEIVVSGTFVKNEEMQSFVTPQADDDSGVYIGTDSEGCFYVELTSDTDDYIGCINSDTYLKEGEQYWIKASFTGTEYRLEYSSDGIDYNVEGFSIESTNPVRQGVGLALGIEYYRGKLEHAGEIYLNECYINVDGKRWWTGAMPSYFTDEATWQKSVNDFGVCGKFVYDSVENSIRLPKVTGFVEGTVDPKALGDLVEAGLPNITGKFESKGINSEFGTINYGEGAFTVNVGGGLDETGNAGTSNIVNTDVAQFDASKSNEIYGNSNTVQPQAIKGYYHIVVATGLVDEIEINPYLEQLEDKTEECIERLIVYGGMPVGTIYPLNCSPTYVADGSLACDGAEYSKSQFNGLWDNYLTGDTSYNIDSRLVLSDSTIINNGFVSNVGGTYFNQPLRPTHTQMVIKFVDMDTSTLQDIFITPRGSRVSIYNNRIGLMGSDNTFISGSVALTSNTFSITINVGLMNDDENWYFILRYGNDSSTQITSINLDGISSVPQEDRLVRFGAFTGQIDLTNSYVIGENRDYLCVPTTNTLLNTCTYAEYEQELATYGQCAKFAVDVENGKFRVPFITAPKRYLIDKKEPTETDTTWYNLYSDGWCEQGGHLNPTKTNASTVCELLKDYINTNYYVNITSNSPTDTYGSAQPNWITTRTVSSFIAHIDCYMGEADWEAKGYIDLQAPTELNYFVVVANGQTNQSMMDWSAWASSLQGKANKTDVDGQWVGKDVLLSEDFTKGTTVIDMSEYLPNDEYDYEVMLIFAYLQTSAAHCHIYSDIIPCSTTVPLRVDSATTVSNGFLNIPIGKARTLYVYKEQDFNTGTYRGLEALAYRRLGKNQ